MAVCRRQTQIAENAESRGEREEEQEPFWISSSLRSQQTLARSALTILIAVGPRCLDRG